MTVTDAVSVFAEGTFEEQVLELVNYLARSLPEEERPNYIQPFQGALTAQSGQPPIVEDEDRQRVVLAKVLGEVKGLGEGSEREIEGFFNLLFAHFLTSFPLDSPETRQLLFTLLQTISSSDAQSSIKYRILTNLFNTVPRRSGLRLLVHQTLLEIANTNDELDQLHLSIAEVEKWVSEWDDVSPAEKSAYLKTLVDAFVKSGDLTTSYQYELSYVRSLPPAEARSAALDVIATALRLPSVFDFDTLFHLDAVVAAKDHELFSLLHIFLNDGLEEYKTWESSHADAFAKYNLDPSQLEHKIRLLSLATLAFQSVGQDLPYSVVASVLQVEEPQVERWIINAIRANLISAKLSQTTHTVHITRAAARSFEREQWEALEKRMVAWKTGLVGVLEVITSAKKRNGGQGPEGRSESAVTGAAREVTAETVDEQTVVASA